MNCLARLASEFASPELDTDSTPQSFTIKWHLPSHKSY